MKRRLLYLLCALCLLCTGCGPTLAQQAECHWYADGEDLPHEAMPLADLHLQRTLADAEIPDEDAVHAWTICAMHLQSCTECIGFWQKQGFWAQWAENAEEFGMAFVPLHVAGTKAQWNALLAGDALDAHYSENGLYLTMAPYDDGVPQDDNLSDGVRYFLQNAAEDASAQIVVMTDDGGGVTEATKEEIRRFAQEGETKHVRRWNVYRVDTRGKE